jgi:hypothetical protein
MQRTKMKGGTHTPLVGSESYFIVIVKILNLKRNYHEARFN